MSSNDKSSYQTPAILQDVSVSKRGSCRRAHEVSGDAERRIMETFSNSALVESSKETNSTDREHALFSDEDDKLRDRYRQNVDREKLLTSNIFSSPKNEVHQLEFDDLEGSQSVDSDGEHDQMEEKGGNDSSIDNDPFANQFLHIDVPATGLKDVSRVKKDICHDRTRTKNTIMSGLHRAVSSVKISEGHARFNKGSSMVQASSIERSQSPGVVSGTPNFRRLSRMLSFKKSKSSSSVPCPKNVNAAEEPNDTCTSGRSILGDKPPSAFSSTIEVSGIQTVSQPILAHAENTEDRTEKKSEVVEIDSVSHEALDRIVIQRKRENIATRPSEKRRTMGAIGRSLTISRQGKRPADRVRSDIIHMNNHSDLVNTYDRPRPSLAFSPELLRTGGRSNMSQIGRVMSLNRRKAREDLRNAKIRNESETLPGSMAEKGSSARGRRSTLAKIGRAISLSRSKSIIKKQDLHVKSNTQSAPKICESDHELCPTILSNNEEQEKQRRRTESHVPKSIDALGLGTEIDDKPLQNNNGMLRPKLKTVSRMFSLPRHSLAVAPSSVNIKIKKDGDRAGMSPNHGKSLLKLGSKPDRDVKLDESMGKFQLITSELNLADQAKDITHIRVPLISLGKYVGPASRSLWHTDVFTLPHNAVRMECMDLYDILVSISQSSKNVDIAADDLDDLEQWWCVAYEFFKFYFEVERRILFPWIDSASSPEPEIQTALKKMRGMKYKLQELLALVNRVWNEKTFKSRKEIFAMVCGAVDDFIPKLLKYFEDQELLLPVIAQNYYNSEARTRIDREIVGLLIGDEVRKNGDAPNHRLVLLIRWLSNSKVVRTWTSRYLSSWARNMYPKWYHMFEIQHHRIVKTFQNRNKLLAATDIQKTSGRETSMSSS